MQGMEDYARKILHDFKYSSYILDRLGWKKSEALPREQKRLDLGQVPSKKEANRKYILKVIGDRELIDETRRRQAIHPRLRLRGPPDFAKNNEEAMVASYVQHSALSVMIEFVDDMVETRLYILDGELDATTALHYSVKLSLKETAHAEMRSASRTHDIRRKISRSRSMGQHSGRDRLDFVAARGQCTCDQQCHKN
eukprot:IDg22870t1